MHEYIEAMCDNPIIAAVQNKPSLVRALQIGVPTIFLLGTDIFSAKSFVDMARQSGSNVFLHMDLIEGLAANTKALDYVQKRIMPSGIISTKSTLIRSAREQGLFCIQRFFMVDSASYDNAVKTVRKTKPSMIELMPGIIPNTIKKFTEQTTIPTIAGGLITMRSEVIDALASGAIGVSTGDQSLWLE